MSVYEDIRDASTWWARHWLPLLVVALVGAAAVLLIGWLGATTAENCATARDAPWQCSWFWQEAAPALILPALALAALLIAFAVVRAVLRRSAG